MKNCNNNKLKTILIIVFAVSLVISFFKIYDLSEQINQINENLIYRDQDIRNQINSIYDNVDNKKDVFTIKKINGSWRVVSLEEWVNV